jgi:hypothetical protein
VRSFIAVFLVSDAAIVAKPRARRQLYEWIRDSRFAAALL